VPPNDIGMMLTPTGYEDNVYKPGQVDIGGEGTSGQGNRLVLIQRSGLEIKEQFLDAAASDDKTDHRCMLGDKTPVDLDVRLLMAIPNYETPEGRKELARLFLLGNPKELEGNKRVMVLSAESIYAEQARLQVRGKIRQLCASYKDYDAIFAAYGQDGPEGFVDRVEHAVAGILKAKNVPLGLVNAVPSNLKPDPKITDAATELQSAQKRTQAIKVMTDFLDQDRTGTRRLVYQMQATQEIVSKANANGHNTVIMGFGASGNGNTMLMPITTHEAPAAKPAK